MGAPRCRTAFSRWNSCLAPVVLAAEYWIYPFTCAVCRRYLHVAASYDATRAFTLELYFSALIKLYSNKDFVLLCLAYGLSCGTKGIAACVYVSHALRYCTASAATICCLQRVCVCVWAVQSSGVTGVVMSCVCVCVCRHVEFVGSGAQPQLVSAGLWTANCWMDRFCVHPWYVCNACACDNLCVALSESCVPCAFGLVHACACMA